MSTRGKLVFPAAILLLSLVCTGIGFASGQREDQLATAQQLIKEKKYNDAILVLTQVMKDKPQEFDRAQSLLEKINKARQLYNDKVAELIKVFNEGKLELAYQIIQELETLDKAPNARTLESQAYARRTATFVYDTKQFETVMDKALAELQAGNYPGAIDTYQSGLGIGLNLFEEANYGNIVADKVNGLRGDIRSTSTQYLALLKQLDAQRGTINGDLGSPTTLGSQLDAMVSMLGKIAAVRKRLEDDSTNLKIQNESIVFQHSDVKTVPLIGFVDRILNGRKNAKQPEGIIATVDDSWNASLSQVYTELDGRAKELFAAAKKSYSDEKWDQAHTGFVQARSYALLADRAAAAWGMQVKAGGSLEIAPAGWNVVRERLPGALHDEVLARASDGYIGLIPEAKSARQIAQTANSGAESAQTLTTERQKVLEVAASLRGIRTTWTSVKEHYAGLASEQLDTKGAVGDIDGLISAVDTALSGTDGAIITIASREGNMQLAPIRQKLVQAQATIEKAVGLIEGVPPKNASPSAVAAGLKEKYPSQAHQMLAAVQTELQGYSQTVAQSTSELKNASPAVMNASSIKQILQEKSQLSSDIGQLNSKVTSSLSQAQQLMFEADRYRQEGENKLRQAQAELANRQFASARQSIAAAANSFDRSLSYQEDPAVRQIRDQQIPTLSSRITDSENAVVVRDVRNDINAGRQYYTQGNYARAQDLFLRAESRWRTTNTEPNPEITTWLKYVNTALTINSGRVVAPTDPLYPEITQVLNLAQTDYKQGRLLISEGKPSQAKSLLSEAQTKLIYVQIPFPLNKEARVLSLKILQLTDPKNFAATFKQKFDQAVAELKSNPQDAYIALKDLQAIEPNYPGMNAVLYQAEILTGMRRPPPDPGKVRESTDLYQKAFDIVRQNVRAQFPIALSYLNRAIELDPNNQQAASLKDRISIDQGAETTVVLSSTDQVQFKLAQEQFIAKSYYEALRIVNQLLKDPANKNFSPLLELKRRIESKI